MKSVPILKSKRCILRDVTDEDLCIIQEIMHDNEFQKFLPELYELINSKEGFLQFFKSFSIYLQQNEGFLWGISLNNKFIGFVAIMDISDNPTLFYAIHPLYRNKGFMTECVSTIVSFLAKHKLCDYIQTEVYDKNIASLTVLLRNGFEKTGYNEDFKIVLKTNIN